ncbi:hypothetical protein ACFCYB_31105, partial [Streptomyces sp. NPDC056309]
MRTGAHAASPVTGRHSQRTPRSRAYPGRTDHGPGIGIGLPGPVEHASGKPTNPPIMPGWDA